MTLPRICKLLLVSFIFLLNSCIEGEEEIWLNADGSGKLVAVYRVPTQMVKQMGGLDKDELIRAIKLVDEAEENISVQDIKFEEVGGRTVFRLEATFENVMELLEVAERGEQILVDEADVDPEILAVIAGEINVEIEGLTPKFSRTIDLAKLIPEQNLRSLKKFPGMLGDSNFRYIFHLPAAAKETNATFVSHDRKTLTWDFPLSSHVGTPIEIHFTASIPIPWWAWLIIVGFFCLLLWFFWRFVIRRFVR